MNIEKLIIMPGIYQVRFFLESSIFYILSLHEIKNKWPYFLLCSFGYLDIVELQLFILIAYPYQNLQVFIEREILIFVFVSDFWKLTFNGNSDNSST